MNTRRPVKRDFGGVKKGAIEQIEVEANVRQEGYRAFGC